MPARGPQQLVAESLVVPLAVIVGDQHVIDLLQSRLMGSGQDAIGIATVIAGPAGIDQQRLTRGAHDQRCLAAFDIDEVDLQRLGSRRR